MDSTIDWNLGGAPAADPAVKKVIQTVLKVDVATSAASIIEDSDGA